MNARTERLDPLSDAKSKYYDAVSQHLQNNQGLAYALVTAIFAYAILPYFGVIRASFLHVLWDILVHLTPSRIVVALDSKTSNLDSTDKNLLAMNFQAKSEAAQRILGVDNASTYSVIPRGSTFSGLGSALLGTTDSIPPGLGNWDNSCYQNSILQGLASLKSFSEYLERNIDKLGEKGLFSTHQALKNIIDQLNSSSSHGQRLWTPPSLKSMSSWQQQDAQEYFSKVVEQLDREVQLTSKRQTKNLGLKVAGPEEHVVGADSGSTTDEKARPVETSETPSFHNPLEGLLAQRVGCMQCSWTEGLSLIPFNCVTVPLGAKWDHDLQECLDQYMNLEPIEGVECAKCTLLHARGQLRSLLRQIEEDKTASNNPESPDLSNALQSSAQERLQSVEEALADDDYSEKTLSKKCHIPAKNRITTTKSRQAVIARTPKCLSIHVNRSLFDEYTGSLRKNYAAMRFPKDLDLNEWCLGARSADMAERWGVNPKESMLPQPETMLDVGGRYYELRALITHYGRHENGHYICYRKYPSDVFPAHIPQAVLEADGKEKTERWYRLSDDDVQMVSESNVMCQSGAFMLFYEAVEPAPSDHTDVSNPMPAAGEKTESSSGFATPEDMSSTSGATDGYASNTSQATSISTSEKGPPTKEPALDAAANAVDG
ncbi:ubiquitin carboxyl-terminal hydrolase [Aspergillus sp. HF37]|nr:ubiquitin carboxyl-terminal hydrolase [Aspergillus sp. HF37]